MTVVEFFELTPDMQHFSQQAIASLDIMDFRANALFRKLWIVTKNAMQSAP